VIRQTRTIDGLQSAGEQVRYAVSHPTLSAAVSALRQNDNGDYKEMRRHLGLTDVTDVTDLAALSQQDNDEMLRQVSDINCATAAVVPPMVDTEQSAHISNTTLTVNSRQGSCVDVITRHDDDFISSRRHETSKDAFNDASHSKPVPLCTIPGKMTPSYDRIPGAVDVWKYTTR